jgi:hypothetical protein
MTGNEMTKGGGKSPRSKLPRAKPTSAPLTLPDAIEVWKRRRLGEAIHVIAAGFRVNSARIAEVLSGKRFPEAEKLSLI